LADDFNRNDIRPDRRSWLEEELPMGERQRPTSVEGELLIPAGAPPDYAPGKAKVAKR